MNGSLAESVYPICFTNLRVTRRLCAWRLSDPASKVERLYYDTAGQYVEFTASHFNPRRYSYRGGDIVDGVPHHGGPPLHHENHDTKEA